MSDFADHVTSLRLALRPFRALLEIEGVLSAAEEAQLTLDTLASRREAADRDLKDTLGRVAGAKKELVATEATLKATHDALKDARALHEDQLAKQRLWLQKEHDELRAALDAETERILGEHKKAREDAAQSASQAEKVAADAHKKLDALRAKIA